MKKFWVLSLVVSGWLFLTGWRGVSFAPELPLPPRAPSPQEFSVEEISWGERPSPAFEISQSPFFSDLESRWRTKRLLATSA